MEHGDSKRDIDVAACEVEGTIPEEISSLPALELSVHSNQPSGEYVTIR